MSALPKGAEKIAAGGSRGIAQITENCAEITENSPLVSTGIVDLSAWVRPLPPAGSVVPLTRGAHSPKESNMSGTSSTRGWCGNHPCTSSCSTSGRHRMKQSSPSRGSAPEEITQGQPRCKNGKHPSSTIFFSHRAWTFSRCNISAISRRIFSLRASSWRSHWARAAKKAFPFPSKGVSSMSSRVGAKMRGSSTAWVHFFTASAWAISSGPNHLG